MDPLKDFKFKSEGSDLFVTIKEDAPVKLRVLTTDPMIHIESKYGSTRFAFVVWNFTENKAQILDKGASIAREIQKLHMDADYGADIQKIDLKITGSGTGKDTRYSVTPLPKAGTLTKEQIAEAAKIDLNKIIKNGVRMSEANAGTELPTVQVNADENFDDIDEVADQPVNMADIPF